MSIHCKCVSLERGGQFYGVVVDFDGFPVHRTAAHASRTAARLTAERFAEMELGKTPFHRIRIGSSIADLQGYLADSLTHGSSTP
jgi:hypothetical protein